MSKERITRVTELIIGTAFYGMRFKQSGWSNVALVQKAAVVAKDFTAFFEANGGDAHFNIAAAMFAEQAAPITMGLTERQLNNIATTAIDIAKRATAAVDAILDEGDASEEAAEEDGEDDEVEGSAPTQTVSEQTVPGAPVVPTPPTPVPPVETTTAPQATTVEPAEATTAPQVQNKLINLAELSVEQLEVAEITKKLLRENQILTIADLEEADKAPKNLEKDIDGIGPRVYAAIMTAKAALLAKASS